MSVEPPSAQADGGGAAGGTLTGGNPSRLTLASWGSDGGEDPASDGRLAAELDAAPVETELDVSLAVESVDPDARSSGTSRPLRSPQPDSPPSQASIASQRLVRITLP